MFQISLQLCEFIKFSSDLKRFVPKMKVLFQFRSILFQISLQLCELIKFCFDFLNPFKSSVLGKVLFRNPQKKFCSENLAPQIKNHVHAPAMHTWRFHVILMHDPQNPLNTSNYILYAQQPSERERERERMKDIDV